MEHFPVDVNITDYKMILRVPGIGVGSAKKIWQARKFGKLRSDQIEENGHCLELRETFYQVCRQHFCFE
jgi:predicted DNA-binding helix-hairpin-helix protein